MLFIKCWSRGEVFISTGWWRVPHKRGWEMTLRQNVSRIRTQPSLAIPQMLAPWRIVVCWLHKPLDFKRRCKLFVLGASDLTNTLKKDLIPVLQSIYFQSYKNLSVFKCQNFFRCSKYGGCVELTRHGVGSAVSACGHNPLIPVFRLSAPVLPALLVHRRQPRGSIEVLNVQ